MEKEIVLEKYKGYHICLKIQMERQVSTIFVRALNNVGWKDYDLLGKLITPYMDDFEMRKEIEKAKNEIDNLPAAPAQLPKSKSLKSFDSLKNSEDFFQYDLKPDHYTFIAPSDEEELSIFLFKAKLAAPLKVANGSLHDVLTEKKIVSKAIETYHHSTELAIYVADKSSKKFSPIQLYEYCKIHNIDFEP
jgi:hypothetical protein